MGRLAALAALAFGPSVLWPGRPRGPTAAVSGARARGPAEAGPQRAPAGRGRGPRPPVEAAASRGAALPLAQISSPSSGAYGQLRRLYTRRGRAEASRFVAEGEKFLRMGPRTVFVRRSRWAEAGLEIEEALVEGGEEGPKALLDTTPLDWGGPLADDGLAGEPPAICVLADELFDAISTQEASQGVLCVFAMPRAGATAWATGARAVVLDAVQDSVNIGVITRTMEAFGATTLITLKGTVDLYNPKVVRCSMGAVVRGDIQILAAEDAPAMRSLLRGYRIFATTLEGDLEPLELGRHLSGKDAFVFGNEARGISEAVLAVADRRVRIPMAPQVNSLNVGVSVGIILHAVAHGCVSPSSTVS